MTKRPIDYRPPDLVVAILNLALDDDDPGHTIPEAELLDLLASGDWKPDTVRRTIRELVDFGALRRLTPPREEPRIRLSVLGRAWVDRRVEPYVKTDVVDTEEPDPDPPESLDLD